MEERHKRIPDYELDTTEPIIERGGQCGPETMPLVWS